MLALQTPRAGTQLRGRECTGIVDEHRRLGHDGDRRAHPLPIGLVQLSGPHLLLIDAAQRGNQAHG
jgi:hypothetical protein